MKLQTLFLIPLILATCTRAQPPQQNPTVSSANPSASADFEKTLLLNAKAAEWLATANGDDFAYLKATVDKHVAPDGTLITDAQATRLDTISLASPILLLYRTTQEKKYALAAKFLHDHLTAQVQLGDAYAIEPFRAAYAATFQQPQYFNDIAAQLLLLDAQRRDPKTGLLHSTLDPSNPVPTSQSPDILAQPVAFYAAALIDTLDWFPRDHPQRPALLAALNRTLAAVLKVQDSTGLWWQQLDRAPHHTPEMHRQPDGSLRLTISHENDSNVLDPSASAIFTYVLAKGARLGYLPQSDAPAAQRAWQALDKKFSTVGPCLSSPSPAVPPCPSLPSTLLARSEIDQLAAAQTAFAAQSPTPARTGLLPSSKDFHAPSPQPSTRRITAMVDAWFNSQTRTNALGQTELFHYKWDDDAASGYSFFGRAFERHQADLATLTASPTRANLAPAQVYIIASPDIPSKNPNPHYMDQPSGDAIEAWVRSGGVLILFSNDRDNTEFTHFNTLSDRFGIHFNPVLSHHVVEPDHATGEVVIPPGTGIFGTGFTAYMKDTSTITPTGPAHAAVTDHGDVMIALSHLGKGTVLAIVDPWFYNEYADGRKMRQYHGFEAADDIAAWAVREAH